MIKVLTQIKRKGYLWKTSQDLKILKRSRKRREREHDNEGRKDKRTQRTKLAEDSSISQAMLDLAQEHVAAMQNEVAGLRDKLQRTSQEAKEKLQ